MISTNAVRPGMVLNLPEGLYQIVEYQHVKPGKGKAFVRMKLKGVIGGAIVDKTFRADENVPRAMIDRRDFQFLYRLAQHTQLSVVCGDCIENLVDLSRPERAVDQHHLLQIEIQALCHGRETPRCQVRN